MFSSCKYNKDASVYVCYPSTLVFAFLHHSCTSNYSWKSYVSHIAFCNFDRFGMGGILFYVDNKYKMSEVSSSRSRRATIPDLMSIPAIIIRKFLIWYHAGLCVPTGFWMCNLLARRAFADLMDLHILLARCSMTYVNIYDRPYSLMATDCHRISSIDWCLAWIATWTTIGFHI